MGSHWRVYGGSEWNDLKIIPLYGKWIGKKEALVETGSPVIEETAVAQTRDINNPKLKYFNLLCNVLYFHLNLDGSKVLGISPHIKLRKVMIQSKEKLKNSIPFPTCPPFSISNYPMSAENRKCDLFRVMQIYPLFPEGR